ncbi:hypothetical protein J2S70_000416 [Trueperella bonasi]|uniref:Transcriptional regulator, AbiEi antitoxin, Type IV TA system n=1 Tax=Trueperella bonasi TaxID=312286 RepID=A0ABT9NEM6_9ACTO|nr:hypothetical protein [Trueperella bonasi]MDP9805834.1 hypothetical protein [Trueperella bonasi]
MSIIRTAEPEFAEHQRAHFEAQAKERLWSYRRTAQLAGRQVVLARSRDFWKHVKTRGYEKIARGYAAILAQPADRENLKKWVEQERMHFHKILYLSQWKSQTAIADLSAALVWGFPRIRNIPQKVRRVTSNKNCGGRSVNHVTRRTSVEPDAVDFGGVIVTSLEQTIVDLACEDGPEPAVVAADFALHNGLTTKTRIVEVAKRQGARPGIRNFWSMNEVADGRVESPHESLMRWRFYSGGFEIPEPQVRIKFGQSERRPDGFDAQQRLIYEADGKGKYELHDGGVIGAFHEERHRDAELEALGFRVLHMTWDDVRNDARFAQWCERLKVFPTVAQRKPSSRRTRGILEAS